MGHEFKKLKVWEKSHDLVLKIYKSSALFPENERYGLISQIRRSAASIPTNIVEGYKRKSCKDFCHFLNISECSLEETKYHLLLSRDLGYLNHSDFIELTLLSEEIGKMLHTFRLRVKNSTP